MMKRLTLILSITAICTFSAIHAQAQKSPLIESFLQLKMSGLGLDPQDVKDYVITDQYTSSHNDVTHIYLQQQYQGIPIQHAQISMHIHKKQLVKINSSFIHDLETKINTSTPSLDPDQAILSAAQSVGIKLALPLVKLREQPGAPIQTVYMDSDISSSAIPVDLEYIKTTQGLRLSWKTEISSKQADHHWHLWVDAVSGKILDKEDQVLHCKWAITDGPDDQIIQRNFDDRIISQQIDYQSNNFDPNENGAFSGAEYSVFSLPLESPNHGPRSVVTDPADGLPSPFGWHDTDGIPGAEYTITRGNNVWAQENQDGDTESEGISPDGGPELHFHPVFDSAQGPAANIDVATVNLFYWNNVTHDVWYNYGFDERSGNFQENNYGRGGKENDFIHAFSQDGRGNNNAFFFAPPDGNNGQMAMFLFTSDEPANYLTINSPGSIAGTYQAVVSSFGRAVPDTMLTAKIILADDGSGNNLACNILQNDSILNGNIALIDRGTCPFIQKVQNAQDAGAVAAIVINNQAGPPFAMDGVSNTISIPSIMVSQADGNAIKAALAGDSVVATLLDPGNLNGKDASLDNGIIVHEYGHGISIRLTGGPRNSGCLNNDEQAGEGWSDWLGLVMTAKASDTGPMRRGIGTFSLGESISGNGFREFPYSTDMSINPHTYDDVKSQRFGFFVSVHGVGSIIVCDALGNVLGADRCTRF